MPVGRDASLPGCVMIVDDETDFAAVLRLILELHGVQVTTAADGATGLAKLQASRPDVLVLDVEMPTLDGPDMSAAMLVHDAGWERIPIVLLSGAADLDLVAARVGTPYFLPKPSALEAILAVIRRAWREGCAPHGLQEHDHDAAA